MKRIFTLGFGLLLMGTAASTWAGKCGSISEQSTANQIIECIKELNNLVSTVPEGPGLRGEIGPVGPPGPEGPAGPEGPKGDPGTDATLPIGTIISSMLTPATMKKYYGDKWVLADGTDVGINSGYFEKTNRTVLPDLQGMFIRGINVDPKKGPIEREAGDYQEDALQEHKHDTTAVSLKWERGVKGQGVTGNQENHWIPGVVKGVEDAKHEDETRPKNVAVYFYIKIN